MSNFFSFLIFLSFALLSLLLVSSPNSNNSPFILAAIKQRKCRLVAVADLHGDLSQTKRVLQIAKIIDQKSNQWIAGCATLVQTGDRVDRHHESIKVIDFLNNLSKEARKKGGKVVQLVGNHEVLNMAAHHDYAHPDEIEGKGGEAAWQNLFSRRGKYGQQLRRMPLIYVDDESKTVFVHGGLTPKWAALGVTKLNRLAMRQMMSDRFDDANSILGNDGPVWDRSVITQAATASSIHKNNNNNAAKSNGIIEHQQQVSPSPTTTQHTEEEGFYAPEEKNNALSKRKSAMMMKRTTSCPLLDRSLELLGGMTRMIVGHTPQMGGKVGMFCDKRLIAADVGISQSMMNQLAAVEILGDDEDGDVVAIYAS